MMDECDSMIAAESMLWHECCGDVLRANFLESRERPCCGPAWNVLFTHSFSLLVEILGGL